MEFNYYIGIQYYVSHYARPRVSKIGFIKASCFEHADMLFRRSDKKATAKHDKGADADPRFYHETYHRCYSSPQKAISRIKKLQKIARKRGWV